MLGAACQLGKLDIVKFLIEKGASVYKRDAKDYTCLLRAIQCKEEKAVDIFKYLFKKTPAIQVLNQRSTGGLRPIESAAERETYSFELVYTLIQEGAKLSDIYIPENQNNHASRFIKKMLAGKFSFYNYLLS